MGFQERSSWDFVVVFGMALFSAKKSKNNKWWWFGGDNHEYLILEDGIPMAVATVPISEPCAMVARGLEAEAADHHDAKMQICMYRHNHHCTDK